MIKGSLMEFLQKKKELNEKLKKEYFDNLETEIKYLTLHNDQKKLQFADKCLTLLKILKQDIKKLSYFNILDETLDKFRFQFHEENCLLFWGEVAKEMNKVYPEDNWQAGYLPIWQNDQLNMDFCANEDNEYYEEQGGVQDENGDWFRTEAVDAVALYKSGVKEKLENAKISGNLDALYDACEEVEKDKSAYFLYDENYENEYQSTIRNYFYLRYRDGVEKNMTGTKELAEHEKVLNQIVVDMLENYFVDKQEVKDAHEFADYLLNQFENWLKKYYKLFPNLKNTVD